MSYFQRAGAVRPDAALGRASELLVQDQAMMALKLLQDVFKRSRVRTWTETHEQAMMKLVEISISLRRNLKDDLVVYRTFCRDVTQGTLEKILNYAVDEAERQFAKAEEGKEAKTHEEKDVPEASAESLIMKSVSGEEVKDRLQREIMTPWTKYLVDCYKNTLEICLKNPDHEDSFHKLASKAFDFCKRHKQRLAFRNHFCRLLREHWTAMSALSKEAAMSRIREVKEQQVTGSPTSKFNLVIKAHLDQLHVAVHFDNWQEAYKAIEEINTAIEYFKVTPKIEIMMTYYTQLAQIFWVSQNWLFHAYALQKLFIRRKDLESTEKRKEDKKDAAAEKQKLATRVVLSVLCIPFWTQDPTTSITPFTADPQREKAKKMATLLGNMKPPSRASLMSDVQQLFKLAHPQALELYNIIERNVQPLTLAEKVEPLFEWLQNNGMGDYCKHLRLVAAVSVIVSSSRVYATISLKSIAHMCRFYDGDIESLLVTVARSPAAEVGLCIDHQSQSIRFEDANISSDILSSTLPNLRKRLANINRMLTPEIDEEEKKITHNLLLKRVSFGLDSERRAIIRRKDIIESRKIKAEKEQEEQKQKQQLRKEEEKQKQLEEENRRIEEEKQKRTIEEKEHQEKQKTKEETKKVITALKRSNVKTDAIEQRLNSGEDLDADQVMDEGKKLLIEARYKEEQKRLNEWHKVHWLERQCKEVEAPMIRQHHNDKLGNLISVFETRKQNTILQLKKDWDEAIQIKNRLSRMQDSMATFFDEVVEERHHSPALLKRAEKHAQDLDIERDLMNAAGRGEADGAPSREPEEDKPVHESVESMNWRGGGSTTTTATTEEAAPKKVAFKARGPAVQTETAEPAPAAPAAADPAPAPASGEKKKWGANRPGAFNLTM